MKHLKLFEELESDVDKFIVHCKKNLDLNTKLSEEYFYNSITSCVIDAVYSIGITYAQTKKVVERYCNYYNIVQFRKYGSDIPPKSEQDTLSNLINRIEKEGVEKMANNIFKNRCKTSTHKSSLLKSEAVLLFAKILRKYGIEYLQDVEEQINNKELEKEIRKIPGQSTGISLDYFYMLAGDNSFVKVDRMMLRFINDAIGYMPNKYEIKDIVTRAVELLKVDYPLLTPKQLDHQLWLYQKNIKGYNKNNIKI